MRCRFGIAPIVLALFAIAAPVMAQQDADGAAPTTEPASAPKATVVEDDSTEAAPESSWKKGRPQTLQYFRAQDQRGLNVFETTKNPGAEFRDFRLEFGAAFTSQVQNLSHRNTAAPNIVGGVDANQLADVGFGFNNSTANLSLHAQLAPGIRVALTSYLSSRHHNETWVKEGYVQLDRSPIDVALLNALMEIVTVRVGHMEINYGDAHFRRSDNGNAVYNPFVGNYIIDAFTTEIGAEVYVKTSGVIAMGALTGGEIRGTVLAPGQRGPAYIGKIGIDRQLRTDLRVRMTGSMYTSARSMNSTLYSGDRGGSRYYYVLENTAATETAQKDSGMINPGFRNQVTAFQLNPFVKFRGVELFGVVERAAGKAEAETTERTWKQYALDTVYRLPPNENLFVGVRYNRVHGELPGITGDVGASRWQAGAGWFVTPSVLAKVEYVTQTFFGYPATNIKNGGTFSGVMLEGVIAF